MNSKKRKALTTITSTVVAIPVVTALSLGVYYQPVFAVDEANLPRFIAHDILSPTEIGSVTRFRSGSGESYTSGSETCRNMKQVYAPPSGSGFFDTNATPPASIDPQSSVPVYSPIKGKVQEVTRDPRGLGSMVRIRSAEQPAYVVTIYKAFALQDLKEGEAVEAGERIASKLSAQTVEVAVQVRTVRNGVRIVPYTSLLTEELFMNAYASRGSGDRTNLVITKDTRDADPLTCDGSTFVYPTYGNIESGVRQRLQKDTVTLGSVL